jgi:hypothetical protein
LVPALLFFSGCQMAEPEAVVINKIAPHILISDPSFNGTVWNTVLRYGDATSPRRCMRGDGQVHFKKFDAYNYCRRQSAYGLIDSICMCDSSWRSDDTDVIGSEPLFFNYQTITATDATYGSFHVIELTLDNMEQDFSAPGPYGH